MNTSCYHIKSDAIFEGKALFEDPSARFHTASPLPGVHFPIIDFFLAQLCAAAAFMETGLAKTGVYLALVVDNLANND